jgi:DNA repair protein NreA
MPKLDCIKCKGKYYTKPLSCGHNYCPIYSKIQFFKTNKLQKEHFLGTAPSVFVGRYGYPQVNVGILAPPDTIEDEAELYDSPKQWNKRKFSAQDVLHFRGSLINSRLQSHVKSTPKIVEMSQEVAMSKKPVDIEFKLEKKPTYSMKTFEVETLMGARAQLKKASFHSTPKVNQKIDKVVSDTDLKSTSALNILYKKGLAETQLMKVLSTGNLGLKTQRKLVPTRWAITAVDDTLGKQLIKQIKEYKQTNYHCCYGEYMGNSFIFLFFPRVWSFELFEMYEPNNNLNPTNEIKCTTDYENYAGRKKYATNTAGGYYACRLGLLEYLDSIKKQSSVIVLRFIGDEPPLGVWVVREAVRKSFVQKMFFNSEKEMIDYVQKYVKEKFDFEVNELLIKSKLLQQIRTQKTIKDYF